MCGRFAFFSSHEAMVRLFGLPAGTAAVEPRWNIAPTQYVPTVRTGQDGVRRLELLYWGLIPGWAKERAIGARMINARAETIAEKPSFRSAWRRRRCLVLASGYYEWQAKPTGKQPYFVQRADGDPFALAGLWESWLEPREPDLPALGVLLAPPEAHSLVAEPVSRRVNSARNEGPDLVLPGGT